MSHYAEFKIETGRIIRRGRCQSQHIPTPRRSNAIALVCANYEYNTVVCAKINDKKIAIEPTLVRRASNLCKPKPIKHQEDEKQAQVTNGQWQDVLDRLSKLEAEKKPKIE